MGADSCRIVKQAPAAHQVSSGDTLWDIAGRFFDDPGCWPAVWATNRNAIPDPHRIYPGQTIWLDREQQMLRTDAQPVLAARRLSPAMRPEALPPSPLPQLPARLLALLQRTPVLTAAPANDAPVVAGLAGERAMAAAGDLLYVRGTLALVNGAAEQHFDLLRTLGPIRDPISGHTLATAMRRVGRADWRMSEPSGLHALQLVQASEEVLPGDALVPLANISRAADLSPHPAAPVRGQVAAVLHAGRWASLHDVVALNRGTRDGLDTGSLVSVVRPARIPTHGHPLPAPPHADVDEPIATLLVFDVLEQASLAIVTRSREPFAVGDQVTSPRPEDR